MRKIFVTTTLIGLLAVFFNCSSMYSPLIKLEGKWTTGGDLDEYHAWYLEYVFKGNTYQLIGYPPLSENGTMKLKETKGDSMLIEFKVQKSDPVYENHDEWVYIHNNQLTINSNTFTRTIEQKE